MQLRAYICSISFCFVFAFLVMHPLLPKSTAVAGMEEMETCAWSSCKDVSPCGEDEKECSPENCNPFMPCSVGYCCYLVENFISYTAQWSIAKKDLSLFNDNRLRSNISECWHPPELIS